MSDAYNATSFSESNTDHAAGDGPVVSGSELNKMGNALVSLSGYESIQKLKDSGIPLTVFTARVVSEGAPKIYDWVALHTGSESDGDNILIPTNHTGPGRWVLRDGSAIDVRGYGTLKAATLNKYSSSFYLSSLSVSDSPLEVCRGRITIDGRFSTISNATNSEAVLVKGSGVSSANRYDEVSIKDLYISHAGENAAAVSFENSAFSSVSNVSVACNGVGDVGFQFGNRRGHSGTPVIQSYLGRVANCISRNHKGAGFVFKSAGSQCLFENCFSASSVDGAHGIQIGSKGAQIKGGQFGANNSGGVGVYFYNEQSGDVEGGLIEDLPMENCAVGEYAIVIDGVTRSFKNVTANRIRANFSLSVLGTLIKFGRAKDCVFADPVITNPMNGGTLCEWSENSQDCVVTCGVEAAKAPIVVSSGAVRAVKNVTGVIKSSDVGEITTAANLTTRLVDGMQLLPSSFVPSHNGVAWNFQLLFLTDDSAASFVPPSPQGYLDIYCDDIKVFGRVAYDATSGEVELLSGSSQFEVLNGVLSGEAGNNFRVTVGASEGKVYVEARKGTAKITVLITPAVYS